MNYTREWGLVLQRKQRIESLVIKRQQNISYLRRFHHGGVFWLNCILLKAPITTSVRRTVMYYYLGMSASNLLVQEGMKGFHFVYAFTQLMEEWEYHFSSPTMQGMKLLLARTSSTPYPQTIISSNSEREEDLVGRTSVHKHNGNVVYEYLMTPPLPIEFDYVEVLTALSDVLTSLYDKFLSEECYSNVTMYDAIMKLDSRIKHHFISVISKEITEMCLSKLKVETQILRNSISD